MKNKKYALSILLSNGTKKKLPEFLDNVCNVAIDVNGERLNSCVWKLQSQNFI